MGRSQRLRPIQKCLLSVIARRLGCKSKTRLDARPLTEAGHRDESKQGKKETTEKPAVPMIPEEQYAAICNQTR